MAKKKHRSDHTIRIELSGDVVAALRQDSQHATDRKGMVAHTEHLLQEILAQRRLKRGLEAQLRKEAKRRAQARQPPSGKRVKQWAHTYANRDWRLQGISAVIAPMVLNGQLIPAGATVEVLQRVELSGLRVGVPVPNPTALFLSLSFEARAAAVRAFREGIFDSVVRESGEPSVRKARESEFFVLLEAVISTTVFAFTALESFANISIPKDFVWQVEAARCTEKYAKDQIERHVSMDKKLRHVLPEVFGVNGPYGTRLWNEYVDVKRLRDRLIHIKSRDTAPAEPESGTDYLLAWLCNPIALKAPTTVLDIMTCFYETKELPRWLEECPYRLDGGLSQ